MSWFDRHRGDADPEATARRLRAATQAAGLGAAVQAACGRRGLRRFVLRFEARERRVRLTGTEAEPLALGGGPPPADRLAAATGELERALAAFRAGLPPGWTFNRGALGVTRDGRGRTELALRLDEDADTFGLDALEVPEGPGHPLEDPAWLRVLSTWEGRVAAVRARWRTPGGLDWRLAEGRLRIGSAESVSAGPLALWQPGAERFEWLLDAPVGDEAPLVEPVVQCDLAEAMELCAYATARRGGTGVFQGELPDGRALFAELRG